MSTVAVSIPSAEVRNTPKLHVSLPLSASSRAIPHFFTRGVAHLFLQKLQTFVFWESFCKQCNYGIGCVYSLVGRASVSRFSNGGNGAKRPFVWLR